MTRLPLATLALVAAVAPAAVAPAAGTTGAMPATVQVQPSRFGRVLFDGRGFALYVFTRDPHARSVCSGACAKAWPPLLVRGRPRAGLGARAALLGTVRRPGGTTQATYAGRPLYRYEGDTRRGQIGCQAVDQFGGRWLVQDARGAPVR